jgi:hypothetical protein
MITTSSQINLSDPV